MRAALVLVALLLAPVAAAHVESYSQGRALSAGPYLMFFEPRPAPPFAESPSSLVVQVSDNATGMLLRDVPATVAVVGPAEFNVTKPLQSDGTGYQIASMTFPAPGNYTARVELRDPENGTHGADAQFEVFPNLPFRIRPVDQALDVYTGQSTPIAFESVDPLSLERKDAFSALDVRIERWSEDHRQFLGQEDTAAQKLGVGVWRIDHVFKEPGMHHIRFASGAGGFNYDQVPLLHVYAISEEAAGGGKDAPAAGALALAALAAMALLRRR